MNIVRCVNTFGKYIFHHLGIQYNLLRVRLYFFLCLRIKIYPPPPFLLHLDLEESGDGGIVQHGFVQVLFVSG